MILFAFLFVYLPELAEAPTFSPIQHSRFDLT
jgi:hypothetical protein